MLQQKYQSVLDLGMKLNVQNGDVKEENGILKVNGTTNTPYERDLLWDEIKKVGGNAPKDIEANIQVVDDSCYHKHTVEKGESLWALADKYYKNGNKYPVISEHNNKENIHPGDLLVIPDLKKYVGGEKLQVLLTALGHDTKGIDGKVGNNTLTALKAFQQANGMAANGELDESTKTALRSAFKNNSKLDGKILQIVLRDAGFSPGAVDGVVGKKTNAAIEKFQSTYGLPANGELDGTTTNWLISSYVG